MSGRDDFEQHAKGTPVTLTQELIDCGVTSKMLQTVLEEICASLQATSTPGFSFGRGGNAAANSWYINNEVPSNLVGIPIGTSNSEITEIWCGSENTDTYDVEIYEHEGDEVNLTLLTTVSIVANRTQNFTGLTVSVTTGRQIAVKIVNGNAKNPKVFVIIKGTL